MQPWPVHYLPETDSTMDAARRLRAAATGDALRVATGRQWRGRGRRGGVWYDHPGAALLTTLAIRRGGVQDPQDSQPAVLALRAGLAVCRMLEGLGLQPRVRWPNDILLDDRKVCGILVEADPRWFLLGIGLNLDLPVSPASAAYATPPAALRELLPDPPGPAELGSLLDQALADALAESDWRSLLEARLAWRGHEVRVLSEQGELRGRIRGLHPQGAVLLETGEGLLPLFTGSLRR